jgi:hypothetical protein
MVRHAAQASAGWGGGRVVDALAAMRAATLLILAELFGVDLQPDCAWQPIQQLLAYIAPGLWWPNAPARLWAGAARGG